MVVAWAVYQLSSHTRGIPTVQVDEFVGGKVFLVDRDVLQIVTSLSGSFLDDLSGESAKAVDQETTVIGSLGRQPGVVCLGIKRERFAFRHEPCSASRGEVV